MRPRTPLLAPLSLLATAGTAFAALPPDSASRSSRTARRGRSTPPRHRLRRGAPRPRLLAEDHESARSARGRRSLGRRPQHDQREAHVRAGRAKVDPRPVPERRDPRLAGLGRHEPEVLLHGTSAPTAPRSGRPRISERSRQCSPGRSCRIGQESKRRFLRMKRRRGKDEERISSNEKRVNGRPDAPGAGSPLDARLPEPWQQAAASPETLAEAGARDHSQKSSSSGAAGAKGQLAQDEPSGTARDHSTEILFFLFLLLSPTSSPPRASAAGRGSR